VVHGVLLSGLVLDDVQENVDRRFAVLGRGAVPTAGTVSEISETPRRQSYRTGTLRTTDFAPWTPSTATSPSRFVVPYKFTGFVSEEGRYGGEVPSNT
jgi:hypothetical protein